MRLFLELVCTVTLTLAVVVAGAFFIARMEGDKEPQQVSQAVVETEGPTEPAPTQAETQAVELAAVETTAPAEIVWDTVPRYYQTDYPYVKFGNGTISTSGCSITCLAMVATYLTDHEYTPVDMAYAVGDYGKTNIERLEYGVELLQLPCEKNEDWRITYQALKEGKVAVVMVNQLSPFSDSHHFIVLAGLTEDGKIIVNDPYEHLNNGDVYMKNAYETGFTESDIVKGLSNSWVFDKATMPEEPFLYQVDRPAMQETRYSGYDLPEEDIYTLACFACVQARDESEQVQQAVLEVLLNRLVSEDYPNTIDDVIRRSELSGALKQMQQAEPDMPQYRAVNAAMYGPYVLPMDVYYFDQWATGGEVWGELGKFKFLHSR